MKKKYLIPIIIIIIAAIPIMNGIIMEQTIRQVFSTANDKNREMGTGYTFELVDYHRRLYSSEITWKIDFGKLKPFPGIDSLVVKEHAKHSFIRVTTTTDLTENEWFQKLVKEKLNGKNPLTITSAYSLFGGISSTWAIAPFSIQEENETLNIGEGSLTISTDKDISFCLTEGSLKKFSVSDKLQLTDLSIFTDLQAATKFLWSGKINFDLGAMSIAEQNQKVDLSNLHMDYSLDLDQKRKKLNSASSLKIDSINADGKTVRNITGQIGVKNLDSDSYDAFMKQYMEIMAPLITMAAEQSSSDRLSGELEQQFTSAGLRLMGAAEKLLTKDLELDISNVSMEFPEGKLEGAFNVKLLKDMTLMQFAPVVGQPSLILDILSLSSNISLPLDMFADNPLLITPLTQGMQTGMFVTDGKMLTHHAETKDGKLFLNGKEVDLDQL